LLLGSEVTPSGVLSELLLVLANFDQESVDSVAEAGPIDAWACHAPSGVSPDNLRDGGGGELIDSRTAPHAFQGETFLISENGNKDGATQVAEVGLIQVQEKVRVFGCDVGGFRCHPVTGGEIMAAAGRAGQFGFKGKLHADKQRMG